MLLALSSIGWLLGESPTKGVIAAMFGLILGMIGLDINGVPRYTFGITHLLGGLDFAAVSIGLFGFSEVLSMIEDRNNPVDISEFEDTKLTNRNSLPNKDEFKRHLMPSVRAGLIGTLIGVLPGAGATVASFLGYTFEKFFKSKVPLGEGAIEGVAAAESANNAACAACFAPLLSLGIPGSPVTAILLSAMMVWGLRPGPLLFTQAPDVAWSTIGTLFISNIVVTIMCFLVIPVIINIIKVPYKYMIPIITFVCIIGAYAINNSVYGIILMLIFGVIGYVFNKYNYPLSPVLLAFVLSDIFELNLRRTLISSQGSLGIFFTRPITLVLVVLMVVMMAFPTISKLIKSKSAKAEKAA